LNNYEILKKLFSAMLSVSLSFKKSTYLLHTTIITYFFHDNFFLEVCLYKQLRAMIMKRKRKGSTKICLMAEQI